MRLQAREPSREGLSLTPGSVTVLVSTRDRPRQLAACMRAIAAADGPDLAAFVVVDQSRGEVADLQAALADVPGGMGLAAKLRHVRTDTVGLSRSRNIGLGLCATEIVAMTDDDCVVDPDWVVRIAAVFRGDSSLAALYGGSRPLGKAAGDVPFPATHARRSPATLRIWDDPTSFGSGNNMAFRREAVVQAGGFDEALGAGTPIPSGEDAEMFFRLLRHGARVRYDPQVQVAHEMWRGPDEVNQLVRGYALGSAVYLTRAVIANGDVIALGILLTRLGGAGLRLIGNVLRGRPARRRTAWMSLAGSWEGMRAVLVADAAYGIGRPWIASRRTRRRRP